MTREECNRKRRERYARQRQTKALLERYAEFAAAIVDLKKQERQQKQQGEGGIKEE